MTQYNVTGTDYDQIKENIKNYLKTLPEFTDYNFEGSAISTLISIYAYNTHYNALHTNLAFGESFLDTANLRSSVISRAAELGYLARSKSAARAKVQLSFAVTGNPLQYTLEKNTKFQSNTNTNHVFVTTEDYVFDNQSNTFSGEIDIYQGKYSTYSYTVNTSNSNQRFIIPNKNVDLRFLTVTVKDTPTSTTENLYTYFKDMSIADITATSKVYFIKETFDGYYEIYFGDGIIGKSVINNNYITISYLATDGADANLASSFTLTNVPSGLTSINITTLENATEGNDRETVDSIKFLAPFYYQSQNRAVTENDYKAIIMNNYSNVDDCAVWGGEKNDPPYYGKVFIAIKPKTNTYISDTTKESIKNQFLEKYNVTGIRPEIVDPDYTFVYPKVVVTYATALNTNSTTLNTTIRDTITNFFASSANRFGQPIYHSKLINSINDCDQSVLSAVVNFTLMKQKEIFSGITGTYVFNFNNTLSKGSITSNVIVVDGVQYNVTDDGLGSLFLTNGGTRVGTAVGTINYNTGTVTLDTLRIDSVFNVSDNNFLKLFVAGGSFNNTDPTIVYTDYNIYTNERDQIITLAETNLTLLPDNAQ